MPIVVRDFGTARPWSNEFSQEFGPNTTGFGADHTATVRCDFGETIEYRVTRIVDILSPTSWTANKQVDAVSWIDVKTTRVYDALVPFSSGMNPRRDVVVPQEETGVAGVVLNSSSTVEWSKTLSGISAVDSTDWLSSFVRDGQVFSDWIGTLSVTYPVAVGISRAVPVSTGSIPADFGQAAVSATLYGAEWRTPVSLDIISPTDRVLSVLADGIYPQSSIALLSRSDAVAMQFLPTVLRDDQIAFESGVNPAAITGDARLMVEWTSGMFAAPTVPTEFRSVMLKDDSEPASWTGLASSFIDVVSLIEFGGVSQATALVSEDSSKSVLSEPEIVAFSSSTAVYDLLPVSEYTLSVLGEDSGFPEASLSIETSDDASVEVEWSLNFVTADVVSTASWMQSVDINFRMRSEWNATISTDTQVLLGILGTSYSLYADIETPIEWSMRVLVDIIISDDKWFDRDAIGASLEPDDWEADHG